MLDSITLKFTEKPDPVVLKTVGITIFVGPNNSGKSLILRELDNATRMNAKSDSKLLSDFEPIYPDASTLNDILKELSLKNPKSNNLSNIIVGKFQHNGEREHIEHDLNHLRELIGQKNKYWTTSQFFRFFITHLDGQSRLAMVQDKPTGNLKERPTNHLALLFQDRNLRAEVQTQVFAALGMHFALDPTNVGQLQIRLANVPIPKELERSFDDPAVEFHKNAMAVFDASDGIKAFIGIYLALKCGDSSTILIDEPEAFLHPPLARKLGTILASIAADGKKSLLIATHSSDFLLGCLQASDKVRVVRLEYSNGKSNCHIVDQDKLRKFYANPLIRSANVLAGLFHDGVVVTESDNDRAFYSEIYFRLAESDKHLPSLLFVNTQGKDTIYQVITVLRSFGVPTVAIPDLDILCQGGTNFSNWLNSANIPTHTQAGLGQSRSSLHHATKQKGIELKTAGVGGLETNDKDAANELLDTMERYGIFPTRGGELEHWLKHLNVPGKKTDWTVEMLKALGSDPLSPNYVKPSDGDVWDHLLRIVKWVRDPARHGMSQ